MSEKAKKMKSAIENSPRGFSEAHSCEIIREAAGKEIMKALSTPKKLSQKPSSFV